MARVRILGGETGDLSELITTGVGYSIESVVFNSASGKGGAYSYKFTAATSDAGGGVAGIVLGLGLAGHCYVKTYIRFSNDTQPVTNNCAYILTGFYTAGFAANKGYLQIRQLVSDGSFVLDVVDALGGTPIANVAVSIVKNVWYRLEVDFLKGAGSGAMQVYLDGVSKINLTSQQFEAGNTDGIAFGGSFGTSDIDGRILYFDDFEVDDAALCGESYVIARQFAIGTPTYDNWNKF